LKRKKREGLLLISQSKEERATSNNSSGPGEGGGVATVPWEASEREGENIPRSTGNPKGREGRGALVGDGEREIIGFGREGTPHWPYEERGERKAFS